MGKKVCIFYAVHSAEISRGLFNPFAVEGIECAVSFELACSQAFVLEAYIRPDDARWLVSNGNIRAPILHALKDRNEPAAITISSDGGTLTLFDKFGYRTTFNLRPCGLNFIEALREVLAE